MSPITNSKKTLAEQRAEQSSLAGSLQARGMSMASLMGREEVSSLVADKGKPPADKAQAFARSSAQSFFSRNNASQAKGAAKEQKPVPKAPKKQQ